MWENFKLFSDQILEMRNILTSVGLFVMPLSIADIEGLIISKKWTLDHQGTFVVMDGDKSQFVSYNTLSNWKDEMPMYCRDLYSCCQPSGVIGFKNYTEKHALLLESLNKVELRLLTLVLAWQQLEQKVEKDLFMKSIEKIVANAKSFVSNLHNHWSLLCDRMTAVLALEDHRHKFLKELFDFLK